MRFDARLEESMFARVMEVFLNGKPVVRAVAFDDIEGWVESYILGTDGYPVVFRDDPEAEGTFRFERRRGTVTYVDHRAPCYQRDTPGMVAR